MSELHLIVGLGNPGRKYEWTRHNFGFLIVQGFTKQYHLKFIKSFKLNGLLASGQIDKQKAAFFLPQTYMNNSGVAVRKILKQKNIPLENILVVCDDLNLEFGSLRLRGQGSDGGHNGLRSLIECLGTKDFVRLRVGIGSPKRKDQTVDFVLSEFSKKEKDQTKSLIQQAMDCCVVWLTEGTTKAMSQFNKRVRHE